MGALTLKFRQVAVTNQAVLVRAGRYNVIGWALINPVVSVASYLKFCDAATAEEVTPGATDVLETLLIPNGPGTVFLSNEGEFQFGFNNGIVIYVSTGISDTDATAPSTGSYIRLFYAANP